MGGRRFTSSRLIYADVVGWGVPPLISFGVLERLCGHGGGCPPCRLHLLFQGGEAHQWKDNTDNILILWIDDMVASAEELTH